AGHRLDAALELLGLFVLLRERAPQGVELGFETTARIFAFAVGGALRAGLFELGDSPARGLELGLATCRVARELGVLRALGLELARDRLRQRTQLFDRGVAAAHLFDEEGELGTRPFDLGARTIVDE